MVALVALPEAPAPSLWPTAPATSSGGSETPPGGDVDLEAPRECRRRLYHVHVPKLVEVGLSTFDAGRRVVAAA